MCAVLCMGAIGVIWILSATYSFLMIVQMMHLIAFMANRKGCTEEWKKRVLHAFESGLVIISFLLCFIMINTVFLIGFSANTENKYLDTNIYVFIFLAAYTILYSVFAIATAIKVFLRRKEKEDGETSSGILQANQLLTIENI